MLSLLMQYLFGFNYEKLKQFKVAKTASTIVCHFATNQSLEQFLPIEGLSPVSFSRHDVCYYGCGRITINIDNQGSTPAYIMKTTKSNKWVLRCVHNTTIILHMNAPRYEAGILQFASSYSYKNYTFVIVLGGDGDGDSDDEHCDDDNVPGYHPTRMVVHKNKKMQSISYCIQKCCMTKDDNGKLMIDHDLSS